MSNKTCYPPSPPLERISSVATDGSTLEALASMLLTVPVQQALTNTTNHHETQPAVQSTAYPHPPSYNHYHHLIPDTFHEDEHDYDLFPFQDTSSSSNSITLAGSSTTASSDTTSTPPSSPGQLFFAALEVIAQEETS
ncbi:hypothetical protein BX666DRAFT_2024734 [Dichotomocladium elegans]|nr:hypothetical protein BX666DRAFT_2024734 [Dichotomocladium elegans]